MERNYKVRCEAGLKSLATIVVSTVIDIGAGPNLLRADFPPPEWLKDVKMKEDDRELNPNPGKRRRDNGVVSLYVKMRDYILGVSSGVFDGLAVDILLRTTFIGRCTRYNLRMERRTIPVQNKPIEIVTVIKDDEYAQGLDAMAVQRARKDFTDESRVPDGLVLSIRVSRQTKIAEI